MTSYYKKINGKNYDRAMLDIAVKSVQGKGDGRISLADSRSIVKQIKDGGKVTDIEKRTLNYILENYKLTETALTHIEKSLAGFIEPEIKKEKKSIKSAQMIEEVYKMEEQPAPEKKTNKVFMILIFILLALFTLFALFKYFYKSNGIENMISEKKEEAAVPVNDQVPVKENERGELSADTDKTEPAKVKQPGENEYLVKDKDTLIKISESLYGDYKKWEEIYNLNKGKISNPTILYPGQILSLPEKSKN